ncbi:hypothetical protein P3T76_015203 [Phytophthora citrophthora]|uniref:RxLR effector protein n=1 Tax=Phytophthora citrophthora TaxID=4793 RepID=A0AAD9FZK6_9STRA|nr:hypothetical protein P3T76_015203 [Phytophthora citrophthora]
MRFTCVLAAIVAAILHTSVASFSPVQDSKTAPENGAAVTVIDSAESGRLLRRVDDAYDDLNDDLEDLDSGGDDSFGEERGFTPVVEIDPFKIAMVEQLKRMEFKNFGEYLKAQEKLKAETIDKIRKIHVPNRETKAFDQFVKTLKLRKAERQPKAA